MHLSKNSFWHLAGSLVCLLAILATFGGHWIALQSFAWARMLCAVSPHVSWATAIDQTFDGKHPCELCLVVEKGKDSEKRPDQQKPAGKIEGFVVVNSLTLRGVAEYPVAVPWFGAFAGWLEPPPCPPPRCA